MSCWRGRREGSRSLRLSMNEKPLSVARGIYPSRLSCCVLFSFVRVGQIRNNVHQT